RRSSISSCSLSSSTVIRHLHSFPTRRSSDLVRNVQVLADRGHQRLATLAPQSLGHVEHEIGAGECDLLREGLIGLQSDDTAEETDRKSTRLNSSHGSISYAVFCLKKINTQRG